MAGLLSRNEETLYRKRHRAARDKREADKIKTIILLHSGWSWQQIAEALLLDDSTVRRYEAIHREHGLDALLADKYTGGAASVSYRSI